MSINSVWAKNVPDAYTELLIRMRMWGEEEESRNGPVITSPDPVYVRINNPRQRVLFDKTRDCNPFFHVMEFVWMMSGSNDAAWISQFNKGFTAYADPGTTTVHGAYGHRWLKHFGRNQVQTVINLLKEDKTTRRAVISMWDPRVDLSPHNDLPCNTSIMFRYVESTGLDMLVVNRSNDLIWGMMGANAVHMTYLHELIAHDAGLPVGVYQVISNNLHIYKDMPLFKEIWASHIEPTDHGTYYREDTFPLLRESENYLDLVDDCVRLTDSRKNFAAKTDWMENVGIPMYHAYMERLQGGHGKTWVSQILAPDWKLACEQYIERREQKIVEHNL